MNTYGSLLSESRKKENAAASASLSQSAIQKQKESIRNESSDQTYIAIVTPDFEDEDDLNTLKRIAYLEDDIYIVVANQKDLEIVQEKLGIDRFSTKWSILSFHEEAGKSDK